MAMKVRIIGMTDDGNDGNDGKDGNDGMDGMDGMDDAKKIYNGDDVQNENVCKKFKLWYCK